MTGLPKEWVKRIREETSPVYYLDFNPNKSAKGISIKGSKWITKVENFVPGPGSYEQKSKIVEGPQYSIYKKYDNKIRPTPGPGDYEAPK